MSHPIKQAINGATGKLARFRSHTNPRAKGLDRPRSEKVIERTSCVSVGCPAGQGDQARGMFFQQKRPEELWGRR